MFESPEQRLFSGADENSAFLRLLQNIFSQAQIKEGPAPLSSATTPERGWEEDQLSQLLHSPNDFCSIDTFTIFFVQNHISKMYTQYNPIKSNVIFILNTGSGKPWETWRQQCQYSVIV